MKFKIFVAFMTGLSISLSTIAFFTKNYIASISLAMNTITFGIIYLSLRSMK